MALVDAEGDAIGKAVRWGWQDAWHGTLVSPDDKTVICPVSGETVSVETCRSCPDWVQLRNVGDGGAAFQMVVCRTRGN